MPVIQFNDFSHCHCHWHTPPSQGDARPSNHEKRYSSPRDQKPPFPYYHVGWAAMDRPLRTNSVVGFTNLPLPHTQRAKGHPCVTSNSIWVKRKGGKTHHTNSVMHRRPKYIMIRLKARVVPMSFPSTKVLELPPEQTLWC